MKESRLLGAILLLCSCIPSLAYAGIKKGQHVLNLQLGDTATLSKGLDLTPWGGAGTERTATIGILLGLQYLYHVSDHVGLGLELSGGVSAMREHAMPQGTVNTYSSYSSILPLARYVFRPEKKLYPYVFGGIGRNTYHATVDGALGNGFTWGDTGTSERRTVTVGSNGLVLALGAGYEGMWKSMLHGVELRWQHFRISSSVFNRQNNNVLALIARFGWKFGD